MAAAITLLGTATLNTTSGTHTVVATPAVNDLIVIIRANTGNVVSTAPTDTQSGSYSFVTSALKATSADLMEVWVRTALIPAASSTTFSDAAGTTTGGGLAVLKVTGMPAAGASAIRQSAVQANQSAATTPTPVLGLAALTTNALIGAVFNATSPATMTPRSSPAYTELTDVGYATPTTGLEVMSINSGETGTSIAWGGTSASAFCSIVVELAFNTSPTVSPSSPADAATAVLITPLLQFVGTDANSEAVQYEVEIDTATFPAQDSPATYYINASDSGPTDAGSNWTNDANAFDGNLATSASTTALGNADTLVAGGTNAPILSYTISQVRARIYASANNVSGLFGSYVTLTTPSGGWTWQKVNDLTTSIGTSQGAPPPPNTLNAAVKWSGTTLGTPTWSTNATPTTINLHKIELEVTYSYTPLLDKISGTDAGFTDINNGANTSPFPSGDQLGYTIQAGNALTIGVTYYWRVRGIDPSGTNIYGAWSATRSFTTGKQTMVFNNYQFVSVGDGMSTGEKIR